MTLLETAAEIHRFLLSCGEPYTTMDQFWLQVNIVDAVFTSQYLYSPGRYAATYWLIAEDEVGRVERREMTSRAGIKPGPVMYVAECGSKDKTTMIEMRKAARDIPHSRIFWHHDGRIRHHGGVT